MIRYEQNSNLAKKLAGEIHYTMQTEGALYDFRKPDTHPILIIMDRKNDPVTPLLKQWTYQAMIHELLVIQNGRVDLSMVADVKPENKEVVLSAENDAFYATNMFLNYAEIGSNIKDYVNDYQAKHHSSKNIESIQDMKKFVEEYPEFQKLATNVAKHVTLVGELASKISKYSLLEVSELEQEMACNNNHTDQSKASYVH
jgi:vacuolar protein sorting-associated protein 45